MRVNVEVIEETQATEMSMVEWGLLLITIGMMFGLIGSFTTHYLGFNCQYILAGLSTLCGFATLLIAYIRTL